MTSPNEKIECEIKYLFPIKNLHYLESTMMKLCTFSTLRREWILDFRFDEVKNANGKKSYNRIRKMKCRGKLTYVYTSKKIDDEFGATSEIETPVTEEEAEQLIKENFYHLYRKQRYTGTVKTHNLPIKSTIELSIDILPVIPDRCYLECEIILEGDNGMENFQDTKELLDGYLKENFALEGADRIF